MYLMFEALGISGDRELMLANLDLLDLHLLKKLPPAHPEFHALQPRRSSAVSVAFDSLYWGKPGSMDEGRQADSHHL